MNTIVIAMWAVSTLVFLLMSWVLIWAKSDSHRWIKILYVPSAVLSGFVTFACIFTVLGFSTLAIPGITIPHHDRLHVLGFKLVQNEGIYLLVDMPAGEPRLYHYPWDMNTAQRLQQMKDQSQDIVLDPDQTGGQPAGTLGSVSVPAVSGESPGAGLPEKEQNPESEAPTFTVNPG